MKYKIKVFYFFSPQNEDECEARVNEWLQRVNIKIHHITQGTISDDDVAMTITYTECTE